MGYASIEPNTDHGQRRRDGSVLGHRDSAAPARHRSGEALAWWVDRPLSEHGVGEFESHKVPFSFYMRACAFEK